MPQLAQWVRLESETLSEQGFGLAGSVSAVTGELEADRGGGGRAWRRPAGKCGARACDTVRANVHN
eukprot:2638370-Rhodomonas_salina.5